MSLLKKAFSIFNKKSHGSYSSYGWYGHSAFSFNRYDEQKLVEEGYASNTDVYAIVRKISETGSHIKWKLVEELRDGSIEEVTEGDLYELLKQPNDKQTRKEFTEEWLTYLLTTGNDYIWGMSAEGMGDVIRQMAILPSIVTEPLIYQTGIMREVVGYQVEYGTNLQIPVEQVLHSKFIDPSYYGLDSAKGLSPLQAGYMSLNASNNRQEAASVMLQNKGAAGILSSGGDYPLTAEEAETVQGALDRKLGNSKNFNRVIATSANLSFSQIGMSAQDLQIIEQGQLTLRELCNLYSLDSSLFNDPANKTLNNRKEATKSLYTESVIPTTQRLIDGLNSWLIPTWSLRDRKNYKIELVTEHIEALQSDQKVEAEKDKIVMEGINIVLNLPISDEGKKRLLMDKYDFNEEQVDIIVSSQNEV